MSDDSNAESAASSSTTTLAGVGDALRSRIQECIATRDLDSYVVALVLSTGFRDPARSPWWRFVADLLTGDTGSSDSPRRADDAAVVGCRLALGSSLAACREGEFAALAEREIRREPLGPLPTLRTDERILLGVAAGIGRAAHDVTVQLSEFLRARRRGASIRQLCLDLWAEALSQGRPGFSEELANEVLDQVLRLDASYSDHTADHIARFWIATRMLSAPLQHSDETLATIEAICEDGRRAAIVLAARPELLRPLDAALLLDALSASPQERMVRSSALSGVLAVIDGFESSRSVLANRYSNRTPFVISDEYDVQDLFRALVLPIIPDLEPEDPAPKVAGRGSRLDFVSRATRLGFEMKHVKSDTNVEKIRKEILIDERTFHTHSYVEKVVAFIHDPTRQIPVDRRTSIENDLSERVSVGPRTVEYIVKIR